MTKIVPVVLSSTARRASLACGFCLAIGGFGSSLRAVAPRLLDDQFTLPPGFHIYRAAMAELTGGSYDLTFDGDGRLLVGDGKAVRRLRDTDGDQVYDQYTTIATGLGGRGPQGLIVVGDRLYAVGGDGVQLYTGYSAGGSLTHAGRLGQPFHTGGDHSAHTLLRGFDDWIYFVTGDGGGTGGRKHITEDSSPVLFERAASVFRFDPEGNRWECIGAGGRNPPSLGMNYLGEFFSFDSDMEWHVDLPFYRPVRLNHWATGGDQGWQSVGAYPPYSIDCLPGVLEAGRGSPNWGVFYEHRQFPEEYRDAFIVCDYRWKSATSGGYSTPGRLVAFHLGRDEATWQATMTLLAQAKPDARDADGNPINFALVDVDVAPDGSLLMTDHNQGVWRLFYDPRPDASGAAPIVPPAVPFSKDPPERLTQILTLPQPMAEWSRLLALRGSQNATFDVGAALRRTVVDGTTPLPQRLRAVRLLAPQFEQLPAALFAQLATDKAAEMRGQAAWLLGIRGRNAETQTLVHLLEDKEPFVRRRAAEALARHASPNASAPLIARLDDPDRFVRYAAMTALAHRPTSEWLDTALAQTEPQSLMRALVAGHIRKDPPSPERVRGTVATLFEKNPESREDRLALLRVLDLFRENVYADAALRARVGVYLLDAFPDADRDVRWEQTRLLGNYAVTDGFKPLLASLEAEEDPITQFHIATALAKIPGGWNDEESTRLARWLVGTQTGWFSEFEGKGLQFRGFWATILNQLVERHAGAVMQFVNELRPGSQLAQVAYEIVLTTPDAENILLRHYDAATDPKSRQRLLVLLGKTGSPSIMRRLIADYRGSGNPAIRNTLLQVLCGMPVPSEQAGLFLEGLLDTNDAETIGFCAGRLAADNRSLERHAEVAATFESGDRRGAKAVWHRLLEQMHQHPGQATAVDRALVALTKTPRPSAFTSARWIWSSDKQTDGDEAWFARHFNAGTSEGGAVKQARLRITCDNRFTAWLNGKRVAAGTNWMDPEEADVTAQLRPGLNVIAVAAGNEGGPAGLIARLAWSTENGAAHTLVTDASWMVSEAPPEDWRTEGTSEGAWRPALDLTQTHAKVWGDAFAPIGLEALRSDTIAAREFWQDWYRERYAESFTPPAAERRKLVADDKLHGWIADWNGRDGDVRRGREVYLNAGCFACHGGVGNRETTIFGPALAGATLRLNRMELADALVFPSKQVAERFKATEVQISDETVLTGFITEQNDEFVSVTDLQNKVTRLLRKEVKSITIQDTSLMSGKLLNRFSREQIRDLLAFLREMK